MQSEFDVCDLGVVCRVYCARPRNRDNVRAKPPISAVQDFRRIALVVGSSQFLHQHRQQKKKKKKRPLTHLQIYSTGWCFSRNRISTNRNDDKTLTMMNCFGDYRLSRFVDDNAQIPAATARSTRSTPPLSSTATGTTTTSPTTGGATASTGLPADGGSRADGSGDLGPGAIAGIVVGVVGLLVAVPGAIVAWRKLRKG